MSDQESEDAFFEPEPTPPAPGWSDGAVVAAMLVGPLLAVGFAAVPLPGVDRSAGWPGLEGASAFTTPAWALLVVLRWLAAARPDTRRLCAVLLGIGSALVGVRVAQHLSPAPGAAFLLTTALSVAAAQAVLWLAADFVDQSERIAGGPWLVWSFAVPVALVDAAHNGDQLAHGAPLSLDRTADLVAWALPLLWLAVTAPSWPVRIVGDWKVRSNADAAFTAWAVGRLAAGLALGAAESWSPAAYSLAFMVGTVAALAAIQREALGSPDRSRGALVGLAVGSVLAGGAFGAAFVQGGGLDSFGPKPFAGEGRFRAVLSTDGSGEPDVPALQARLDQLGVRAEVRSVGSGQLEVVLDGVGRPNALMAAVLQGGVVRVSMEVPVDSFGPDPLPPGVTFHDQLRAARADQLVRVQAPNGLRVAAECPTEGHCVGHVVGEPILTNADLVDARVALDLAQRPRIALTLGDAGRAGLGDATADKVGQRLVVEVDDRVVTAPTVAEPIRGGSLVIDPGSEDPAVCRSMAAAMLHPLGAHWQLTSVDPVQEGASRDVAK